MLDGEALPGAEMVPDRAELVGWCSGAKRSAQASGGATKSIHAQAHFPKVPRAQALPRPWYSRIMAPRADVLPPSSRSGERAGYQFATVAALVRGARMQFPDAQRLVEEWARYVSYRRRNHKTPQSTAAHIHRFETQRLAQPWGARRDGRGGRLDPHIEALLNDPVARDMRRHGWSDKEIVAVHRDMMSAQRALHPGRRDPARRAPEPVPKAPKSGTRLRRGRTPREGAGEQRVSAKGIPYTRCPRGTRMQAIVFPKPRYTLVKARAWAKAHDFVARKIEESPNFVRIQLVPSELFVKGSFRNIPMSERFGIRQIIGCPKVEVAGRSSRRGVRPVELVHFRLPGERRKKAA